MLASDAASGPAARDYLRVLARRKWLVLVLLDCGPGWAFALSSSQPEKYSASAEVLLSRQNLAAQLAQTNDQSGAAANPERVAATQASIARIYDVAERALSNAGTRDETAAGFLGRSSVSAKANADILVFTVTDRDPRQARSLATAYAKAYTAYRRDLDTAAVKLARQDIRSEIRRLSAQGATSSAIYRDLVDKDRQLRTLQDLQTANATLVNEPRSATRVAPQPVRSAALGIGLGIVLSIVVAFLFEAFDTRVRSAAEVQARLGLPLLARLPQPNRRLRSQNLLAMLDQPDGMSAEAIRILATNLEFANFETGAKSLLVTSASPREGKTTTIANLAVSLTRGGRKVVLLDADFRRPALHRQFDPHGAPGLTQVLAGRATLAEALFEVPVAAHYGVDAVARAENGSVPGSLHVICGDATPPNAGEYAASNAMRDLIRHLSAHADIVLVDTSPLLGVGDAIALTGSVDGVFLVARLSVARRPVLAELRRVLSTCPTPVLGFALTDAELDDQMGYAYGQGYMYARKPAQRSGRPSRQRA